MNKTHIPCNSQNAERTYEVLSYYFNKKDNNIYNIYIPLVK